MSTLLTALGVAIAAFALWWAHFRLGRLAFSGHSGRVRRERDMLTFTIRVYNSGSLPVHLKALHLRAPKGDFLSGDVWTLVSLSVDEAPVDIRRAMITFTSSESHLLSCDFMRVRPIGQGNVGVAFLDLVATEKNLFSERRRTVLNIQVSIGDQFRIAFPGSDEYLDHLRRERG